MGATALWRATVVARRTGIPAARLLEGEREKLLQLADH
jgi:ATP-dependent Clp protease ATP-binding subunit ClpA